MEWGHTKYISRKQMQEHNQSLLSFSGCMCKPEIDIVLNFSLSFFETRVPLNWCSLIQLGRLAASPRDPVSTFPSLELHTCAHSFVPLSTGYQTQVLMLCSKAFTN